MFKITIRKKIALCLIICGLIVQWNQVSANQVEMPMPSFLTDYELEENSIVTVDGNSLYGLDLRRSKTKFSPKSKSYFGPSSWIGGNALSVFGE